MKNFNKLIKELYEKGVELTITDNRIFIEYPGALVVFENNDDYDANEFKRDVKATFRNLIDTDMLIESIEEMEESEKEDDAKDWEMVAAVMSEKSAVGGVN